MSIKYASDTCKKCGKRHALTRATGQARCQAHSKRSKEQCGAVALHARPNCKHHDGGASRQSGTANPAFKTGAYSKYMPKVFGDRAAEFARNPDLLSLRESIAVTDAMVAGLLRELDDVEHAGAVAAEEATALVKRFDAATAESPERVAIVGSLLALFRNGVSRERVRREVAKLFEQKRKLIDSETRRQLADEQSISADRAIGMVVFVSRVLAKRVREMCDDEQAQRLLAAIQNDMRLVIGRETSQPSHEIVVDHTDD